MLKELQKKMTELKNAGQELENLKKLQEEMLPKVKELELKMLEEQKDVKTLERVSFKSLLYTAIGKKGEKLEKEREEAEEAVRKYKEICQELKYVNDQISTLQMRLKESENVIETFEKEVRRKRNQLTASGGEIAKQIFDLEKILARLQEEMRQIDKASRLGAALLEHIAKTSDVLKKAEDISVKQSFAGPAATLLEIEAGNLLSKAQEHATKLTEEMNEFQEQLKNIFKEAEEQVSLESFYEFGNGIYSYLVDSSSIMEVALLQRIRGARGLLALAREQTEKRVIQLEEQENTRKREQEEIEKILCEIIVG